MGRRTRGNRLREWLTERMPGRPAKPPDADDATRSTSATIARATAARHRLNAEIARFNQLANQVRDGEWRRHD